MTMQSDAAPIAPPAVKDDHSLVDRARKGDERAVRALIRDHNQMLFRVARGIIRDDAEAEDIVQETYVTAFTKLHQFRGDAAFGTWLTRIAMNEAMGRRRTRIRRPTVDLSVLDFLAPGRRLTQGADMSAADMNPEAAAARSEARFLLEAAIDDLPEKFRMVFILREIEGYGVEETSALLRVGANTVKTRLFRARRMIRKRLSEAMSAELEGVFPFDGARCTNIADRVVARLGLSK